MPEGMLNKLDHNEIIRDEEILELVEESVKIGIKKVRITGGEPLVRKGIYDLIKKINQIEGIEEIVLTTNGILLKDNIHKLKESGIKRINLSLDSLQKERYLQVTNNNQYLDYKALIKELKEHNICPIKINAVLLKGINDDEILDFYQFAQTQHIDVRFIELMPFHSPNFKYEDYYISIEDIIKKYPQLKYIKRSNNVDYYVINETDQPIGFINAISDKFCENCNRIRLTSDGYLKPCLHSNNELYVKDKHNKELLQEIKKAVKQKPKSHSLDKTYTPKSKRSMNKIGG
jgi:cyclic pyranopterin phosphate synthase